MLRTPLTLMLAGWLALLMPVTAFADSASPEKQRHTFQQAWEAGQNGNMKQMRALAGTLEDYPLYPYLRFAELRDRLATASADELTAFIDTYADTPLAGQLLRAWLHRLAAVGDWERFLSVYQPAHATTALQCHYATARINTGDKEGAWPLVDELWLVGWSQPDACDPAFAAWRQAGRQTPGMVIARIELAMERGSLRFAGYLKRFLPTEEQPWVDRWQRIHRNPDMELAKLDPKADPVWNARLFTHGVRTLAGRDAARAAEIWQGRERFALSESQVAAAERVIGLYSALHRQPGASSRLAAMQSASDVYLREWRVRAALWEGDWQGVLAAINAMPETLQEAPDWLYWRGRALEELGRDGEAKGHFHAAARCRCYYGLLAAERIGAPPVIDSEPLPVTPAQVVAMAERPAMRRVHELLALEMHLEARREWRDAISRKSPEELRIAARLAHEWDWPHQVIVTLGRSPYRDDLELRFPLPYREQVEAIANELELDLALVYAVMRQESAFYPEAVSSAGALGLMQLMPATARMVARELEMGPPRSQDLLSINTNVRLGTGYLRHLLERYDDNLLYTLIAYNAGPHRVSRWLPDLGAVPADIWVETIPFNETRGYVKRVLTYMRIYEWRMGRELTPISVHLTTVRPVHPVQAAGAKQDPPG